MAIISISLLRSWHSLGKNVLYKHSAPNGADYRLIASWFHVSRVCSKRMYPALIMFVMSSSTNDIAAA